MSKFNVLSLGEFIHQEGIDITLEAFAEMYHEVTSKHQKQMSFAMVTKGILSDYINEKINNLKIQEAIEIVPWSEQEVIEDWYEKASIMLLPSNGNISKLVSEAFSFGLPVVCYENEKLYDIIDHSCGMMVTNQTTQQNITNFSEILRMLYFDPEARKILKKGATRKYESKFSWGLSKAS